MEIAEKPLGSIAEENLKTIQTFCSQDVLLGYQKRWIADESPLKIGEKSRRTGITWAEAADASLCASTAKSEGGCNHFYVGSNKEMAREFIEAVAMWSKAFDRAAGDIQEEVFLDDGKDGKEILTFVVYFASGFKVQALSSNPSNLRGMQGNVTIDEAAFHDRLAEVLKAALALTMWGSKVRLISTHNGVENLFNELIVDSRAGKKRYSVHRITLDDACAEGLYKRICQVTRQEWSQEKEDQWKADLLRDTASEEDALEEYCCVPKAGGGAYLSRALIESRMEPAPVLRYTGTAAFNAMPKARRRIEMEAWLKENIKPLLEQLNPNDDHVLGEDFARSGDLTVLAPGAIKSDLRRVVPFLVELQNVPFDQQKQVIYFIIDGLPRFRGGAFDARGNGQMLAEEVADDYGAQRIHQVMLSQSWYLANMPHLKAAFEDDTITIPKDKEVVDDLRAVQVIKGIPKVPDGNTGDSKKKRHGDAAIALAMMWFASLQDGYVIEYTAAPLNKSRWDGASDEDDDDDIYNYGGKSGW
jgi:phage FluMu gp28-like protein